LASQPPSVKGGKPSPPTRKRTLSIAETKQQATSRIIDKEPMHLIAIQLKLTNCFLVPHKTSYLLVDTGYEYEWHRFIQELASRRVRVQDISHLILTHAHDDHAGLAARLIAENPAIVLVASRLAAEGLASGKHLNMPGAGYINRRVGFLLSLKGRFDKRWTHTFPPCPFRGDDFPIDGDCVLSGGQTPRRHRKAEEGMYDPIPENVTLPLSKQPSPLPNSQ
jgi:glyoxylase-like metal-dependent hydrolase (beta-lactamase superfamily II)